MNRGGNKDHSIGRATLLMWVMNFTELNNIFKPFVVCRPTWGDLCQWGIFPSVRWRDLHTAVWVAVLWSTVISSCDAVGYGTVRASLPSLTSLFTLWFLYFYCSCQTFTFNIYTDLLTVTRFWFLFSSETVNWISLCCGHKTFKEVIHTGLWKTLTIFFFTFSNQTPNWLINIWNNCSLFSWKMWNLGQRAILLHEEFVVCMHQGLLVQIVYSFFTNCIKRFASEKV